MPKALRTGAMTYLTAVRCVLLREIKLNEKKRRAGVFGRAGKVV
jgi:hypothetical protein